MKRTLLFSILFFLISVFSFGQVTKQFNASGTFVVPAGVTSITVQAWGGGGAGGGTQNAPSRDAKGGAGGGGGAYSTATLTVTPGSTLTVTVAPAKAASAAGVAGGDGGDSYINEFSTLILAAGGKGGAANLQNNTSIPQGGAGGSVASSKGTATAGSAGGNGSETTDNISSGAGGNGANTTNTGGAAVSGYGFSGPGNNGSQPGGGGSGSRTSEANGLRAGGAGGAGRINLIYNCPTSAGTLSGTQYFCTYNSATTTFTSTVPGGTWSISSNTLGATVNVSTGVISIPQNANGSALITYTIAATTDCTTARTATRMVYASNGPSATPTITGSTSQCQGTSTIYSITPIPGASSYAWSYEGNGTGATITPSSDGTSATFAFSATATSGNIRVYSYNACGSNGPKDLGVTIATSSNGGTLVSSVTNPSGCTADSYITHLELNGYVGAIQRWEQSTDNFVSNITTINTNASGMNIGGNIGQTTSYRVIVQNSPCTPAVYSTVATVTIKSTSYTTSAASSSTPADVCIGTAIPTITHTTTGATGIGSPNNLPTGVSASFSSSTNTITITGIPSVAGSFNYSIPLTGGCGNAVNATGTITVRQNTVTASSNPNTCISVAMTAITHTTTGATGISNNGVAGANGLPPGVSASWLNNTITISGTPTTANSYSYSIPLTGGCGTVNATGTITVNANKGVNAGSSTPTTCINTPITTITHTTTGGVTGIGSATGLPTGINASFASNTITISGTPSVSGTFNYSIQVNGCGSTAVNATGTIYVNANKAVSSTSPNATTCINTAIPTITHMTTGGVTGIGTASGLPNGVNASFAGNTITITGVPSASGNFNYSIPLVGCGSTNVFASGIINVTANNTVTTASSSPTPCINSVMTNITHTTVGATGISNNGVAGANGLPPGVSASWTSNVITISGTPTNAATYSYSIPLTGGCGVINATGTITVNPILTPSVTITQTTASPVCQGSPVQFTSSVTNGGTSPSYRWYKNGAQTNQTGSTFGISDLVNGDKITLVITSNASCLSTATATSNEITPIITMTDRGRTQGVDNVCAGDTSPLLTTVNYYGPGNVPYTDTSKILYWEYSTDGGTIYTKVPNVNGVTDNNKGKNTYQPGILTVNTKFRSQSQTTGCPLLFASIEIDVKVKPLPTVTFTTQPGSESCRNTNIVYTTQANQFAYLWTIPGTAGTDYTITGGSTSTNTVTIRWSTIGNKTVTVNYKNSYTSNGSGVPNNDGCYAATAASATTLVVAPLAAPGIVTIIQPTCTTPTGGVTLNGLPSSGTLIHQGPNSTTATYSITGTTMTISGLATGDYTFAINNTCNPVYSATVSIKPANKWNGSAWSYGTDPTINDIINFDADYSLDKNINGCSCNIADGIKVKIASEKTMTITNAVTITGGGSLEFMNDASLVQTANIANTGNIIYHRTTEPVRRYDFTYWSSPVKRTSPSAFTMHDLSPDTLFDKYSYYDDGVTASGWVFSQYGVQEMLPAVGYAIRAPQSSSITDAVVYPATFIGVPNNGPYNYTPKLSKWNLVGNPYPSAIDADKFISINHTAGLDVGALYFWTHNSPPTAAAGQTTSSYSSNDYAIYSLTGSTRTQQGAAPGTSGNIAAPSGYIAAGVSFFIQPVPAISGSNTNVQFTNGMRIGGNNTQFFKTTESNTTEKNRLWLNFTNSEGAFKQALVGYVEGATNDWDTNYDATTMAGNSFIDFYSINGAGKLTIQGRALPFVDTDRVQMGYKTTVAGDFTIAIDKADGIFTTQTVYLEDKTTGYVVDLSAKDYTFKTEIGTFIDRFTISYTKKTLGTGDFESLDNSVLVSVNAKVIKVNSTKESISEVTIYDITGKTLYNKKKVGAAELQIPNLQSGNQVLLVKVTLDNDYSATKKIIFQ